MQFQPYAPYERPALTKGYLFPLDKKPARLPVRIYHLHIVSFILNVTPKIAPF